MKADLVIRRARQVVTLAGPEPDPATPNDPSPLALIENGAVACAAGRIIAVGTTEEVDRAVSIGPNTHVIDADGAIVAPGFIDAHTHSLFVGDRSHEFAQRLAGATYAEIAAHGGGIANSVRALRSASDEDLVDALAKRLQRMRAFGVTSVEVKTGYGLDTVSEVRSLRAIHVVRDTLPTRVFSTFLPLHAVDPDLRDKPDGRRAFLDRACIETLPAALLERPNFIDAYIDTTGFSVAEARPILQLARDAGLGVRLHVGQFADVGGCELAAELGALSADHLEHTSDAGLMAMSRAGVVAVLLPGAAFSLGQSWPDARRFRQHGVSVAVATDCNPGTSNTENLPLMVSFAVRQMGLSIVEGWWSITRAAAKSLGRTDLGHISTGNPADLCVLDLPHWEALPYRFGGAHARVTVINGRIAERD